MIFVRHVGVKIVADGEDVSGNLSPYLKSITYTDNSGGEADTAEIELRDDEKKFIGDWLPKRGLTVSIKFFRENWHGDNQTETFDLGSFELDEITVSYPPSTARFKLNSIPQNSGLRQRDESKSWENVRLSQIANDVATKAGVLLCYETLEDPMITRAEQSEVSSLAFLEKLCSDNGLALKVSNGTLIIFDETKLELQSPVATLDYDLSTITRFQATATLQEIYQKCEVVYKHGQKDEKISASYEDASKDGGKTLRINQRVETQAEAEKLAKKKLRDKNKKETTIRLTTVGRFELVAGNVVELVNHGKFSGRYLIEKSTHRVGNGYTVDLELRKCLEKY